MSPHNDAEAASSRPFDFLCDPWTQAVFTGVLTLVPVRNYPSWLRRGIIWAPTVIGSVGLSYLAASPAALRKLTDYIPKAEQTTTADQRPAAESPLPRPRQSNRVRTVARTAVGGAVAGSAISLVMALSFWVDEKLESGLRRLKVPFPRVVMGAAAGAVIWYQVNQENYRDK